MSVEAKHVIEKILVFNTHSITFQETVYRIKRICVEKNKHAARGILCQVIASRTVLVTLCALHVSTRGDIAGLKALVPNKIEARGKGICIVKFWFLNECRVPKRGQAHLCHTCLTRKKQTEPVT